MSTHMHTLTYASIYMHTHTHIYAHVSHVSTHIHTCSHIYGTHKHSLRLLHIHTCIHMYPHIHVSTHMHIHTYIHMHTHASVLPWFDLHYLQVFLQPFCTPSFLCVWKNSMWQGDYAWFCMHFLITAQWSKCCYHNALLFQMKRKSSRKELKIPWLVCAFPAPWNWNRSFAVNWG